MGGGSPEGQDKAFDVRPIECQKLAGRQGLREADGIACQADGSLLDGGTVDLAEQLAAHVTNIQGPLAQNQAARGGQHRREVPLNVRNGSGGRLPTIPDRADQVRSEPRVPGNRTVRAEHVRLDAGADGQHAGVVASREIRQGPIRAGRFRRRRP